MIAERVQNARIQLQLEPVDEEGTAGKVKVVVIDTLFNCTSLNKEELLFLLGLLED